MTLVASLVINKRTKVCEQPHRHLKSLQIFGKRASLALRLLNFTRSLLLLIANFSVSTAEKSWPKQHRKNSQRQTTNVQQRAIKPYQAAFNKSSCLRYDGIKWVLLKYCYFFTTDTSIFTQIFFWKKKQLIIKYSF